MLNEVLLSLLQRPRLLCTQYRTVLSVSVYSVISLNLISFPAFFNKPLFKLLAS